MIKVCCVLQTRRSEKLLWLNRTDTFGRRAQACRKVTTFLFQFSLLFEEDMFLFLRSKFSQEFFGDVSQQPMSTHLKRKMLTLGQPIQRFLAPFHNEIHKFKGQIRSVSWPDLVVSGKSEGFQVGVTIRWEAGSNSDLSAFHKRLRWRTLFCKQARFCRTELKLLFVIVRCCTSAICPRLFQSTANLCPFSCYCYFSESLLCPWGQRKNFSWFAVVNSSNK